MPFAITPETRIGELLDTWPQLEAVLVALSPTFGKLKNPVLRRTVARVASVETAARMAGLDPRELVLLLRAALETGLPGPHAGAPAAPVPDETGARATPAASADPAEPPPDWTRSRVIATLDVDAALDAGDHPLGRLRALLRDARPGAVVRLDSGFRPEPLLEALAGEGRRAFAQPVGDGRWVTWVEAGPAAGGNVPES